VAWNVVTASLPAGSTSYTSTGLAASTSYRYRVKATNAAGGSGYSNVVTVTTPPGAPAALFAEDFTGVNGAAWAGSRWIANTGTTASMDIQSNAGRMRFQNVANARALAVSQMTKQADTEVLMSYRFTSTAAAARGYLYLASRGSGDWVSGYPGTSYFLQLTSDLNTAQIWKSQAGTTTSLRAPTGIATLTTAKQWLRYRIQGNTISAKIWTDGTTEPTDWEITATDTSITGTGLLQMKWQRGGSATTANDVTFDDITITNVP
ncbi:MAG: fibronectin type III domain-containing protein, partial [Actinomycetes bacterium]